MWRNVWKNQNTNGGEKWNRGNVKQRTRRGKKECTKKWVDEIVRRKHYYYYYYSMERWWWRTFYRDRWKTQVVILPGESSSLCSKCSANNAQRERLHWIQYGAIAIFRSLLLPHTIYRPHHQNTTLLVYSYPYVLLAIGRLVVLYLSLSLSPTLCMSFCTTRVVFVVDVSRIRHSIIRKNNRNNNTQLTCLITQITTLSAFSLCTYNDFNNSNQPTSSSLLTSHTPLVQRLYRMRTSIRNIHVALRGGIHDGTENIHRHEKKQR